MSRVTFTCFCWLNSPGCQDQVILVVDPWKDQTNSVNAKILRTIGTPTPPGRIPNIFDFYLRRHRWQKWEYDGDPLKFSQIPGRNLKISTRANEFISPLTDSLLMFVCLVHSFIMVTSIRILRAV